MKTSLTPKNGINSSRITPNKGKEVIVYTDGGTRNTGNVKGGHVKTTDLAAWAYLIEWDDHSVYGTGGEYGATNNKMEQTAVIEALKKLLALDFADKKIRLVLDSQYVVNAINQHWLSGWKKRGWRRSSGSLANAEEWQEIDHLLSQFSDYQFEWTRGHNGDAGNEFVDSTLNQYMDQEM
ncbi:hypothetical protein LCB40_15990 [Lactobacillus corticis]|uniref:ribonuclease H n=1 Tax=Lactobacillus corticis TaxID=2201249 RepID=A0A916VJD2_9LACO|nr:hypothetical protein LCB40_15990 [Lactobacillus corticis]